MAEPMTEMKAVVHSVQAGVRIEFKVDGILTGPHGALYIDGSTPDGTLYTIAIQGTDLEGRTFTECLGNNRREGDPGRDER